ncbi:EutN/CcmL family microcompartment protein [Ruegeria sp. Ofav3-42]|uniref:EutN/CcmL family microcompartment protein n=1 Tax=Ruegeria sp. Ofav3-42 TaxID=2917759 RepID=UPI001EF3EC21|nr:EutN/CcmL family microcompartment protein [Ruegeria sp. Ofav3-42]MCG7521946.1 hypothetical protein [Ruegeria sp. Ofav3-42]
MRGSEMLTGKITGNLWSLRTVDDLPSGTLVEVDLDHEAGRIIAYDPLVCAKGEKVLVTTGAACAAHFPAGAPIDALIIASLE